MKNTTLITLFLCSAVSINVYADEPQTLAEITIGERLFLETRFSQAWYKNPGKADPALAKIITTVKSRVGKFSNDAMNCRACHMVDEHNDNLGTRTYADFTAASPIPNRNDGKHQTRRNSMSLVNISKTDIDNILFHFDGEFNSLEDLVVGTFTGRNFGWQTNEKEIAIKHLANIIRADDGKGELATKFGGSYREILKGTNNKLTTKFRLPPEYRIDVDKASDSKILNTVAKLISAYMKDLRFSTDKEGLYNGSPYDAFLSLNELPRSPAQNETKHEYGQRLLRGIDKLKDPKFVLAPQGEFKTHTQEFVFAKKELKGLQLFLRSGNAKKNGGNCASCHQAPHFTDFRFHNTGISQNQYDQLHGADTFNKIKIPKLAQRNSNTAKYLPASAAQPNALSMFRAKPSKQKPGNTDLGLWNITANANIPGPQKKIKAILCKGRANCTADIMLNKSIAAFKTPSLRDTGHSAPYMHTGELNTLSEVIAMYISNSELAKQDRLRNSSTEILKIELDTTDIKYLIAFLNALNEDYD